MDLREIGWEVVDWMHLAQDRDKLRAVVNPVMNLPDQVEVFWVVTPCKVVVHTTRCHNLQDLDLNLHRHESLKSQPYGSIKGGGGLLNKLSDNYLRRKNSVPWGVKRISYEAPHYAVFCSILPASAFVMFKAIIFNF
jgi:hypothetical protein